MEEASSIRAITNTIASSFRAITSTEKKKLKPLQVKIKTVTSSDTIDSLAGQMTGVSKKVELFKALNGLNDEQRVVTGQKVKIIED